MPLLSVFTKLGHLKLTSKPSHGELLYKAKINALGDQFDVTEGSRMDSLCYAQAMGEARVRYKLERAGNQLLPSKLLDCLAKREAEFGVAPAPTDSIATRRAVLEARYSLPLGNSFNVVKNALSSTLGSDFLSYHTVAKADAVVTPTNINDQPMLLQAAGGRRLLATSTSAVTDVDFQTVTYTPTEPAAGSFAVGDSIVVEPEVAGLCEVVTVSTASPYKKITLTGAVSAAGSATVAYSFTSDLQPLAVNDVLAFGDPNVESVTVTAVTYTGDSAGTFTATFASTHAIGDTATTTPSFRASFLNAHSSGCLLTTQLFPDWQSTKRHAVIVVTAAAASDTNKRRKVNELMARIAREVSTWSIVPKSTAGHTGAFVIGTSILDANTIGDITYT